MFFIPPNLSFDSDEESLDADDKSLDSDPRLLFMWSEIKTTSTLIMRNLHVLLCRWYSMATHVRLYLSRILHGIGWHTTITYLGKWKNILSVCYSAVENEYKLRCLVMKSRGRWPSDCFTSISMSKQDLTSWRQLMLWWRFVRQKHTSKHVKRLYWPIHTDKSLYEWRNE